MQLRDVRERADYLVELEERRATILKSIDEQGKLDDALRAQIGAADTKQVLEDLYLPYKPKRRTRAMIARERGLGPLAEQIWSGADRATPPCTRPPLTFVDAAREVPTVEVALQGARDILAEQVAEDATIRGWVREMTRAQGIVRSSVQAGEARDDSKFTDYFDYREPLGTIPSHRMLAIRRGEAEGVLLWRIEAPAEAIVARLTRELLDGRRAAAAADARRRRQLQAPALRRHRGRVAHGAQVARRRRSDHHLRTQPGAAPPRPARRRAARRSGSTRASAPGSRSRWSPPPVPWYTPTRSTCTRKIASPGRFARSCRASRRSSSPSATGQRAARPRR